MPDAPPHPEPAPLVLETELDVLRSQLLRARVADASLLGAIGGMFLLALNAGLGSPVAPVLVVTLAVACAVALPLLRRPGRLETAARVDAAYRLQELLSSALLTADRVEDWSRVVRAHAERTLATLPAMSFRLFSPRAHAGVWLLVSAVTVVALLGRAASHTDESADLASVAAASTEAGASTALAPAGGIRTREAQSEMRGSNTESATDNAGGDSRARASAGDDARGTGRADAANSGSAAPRAIADGGTRGSNAAGATPAGGDGRPRDGAAGNAANPSAAGRTAAAARSAAAPWQSDAWAARRDAAQVAVETGRVPDAYRDLVRDYFDR